jgi:hypothetical protein
LCIIREGLEYGALMERTMALPNGVSSTNRNGSHRANGQPKTERTPRRIILLTDGEQSEPAEVLLELRGEEITGNRLHSEIQKQAAAHPGRLFAAEWLGKLGWTRFLWCRK